MAHLSEPLINVVNVWEHSPLQSLTKMGHRHSKKNHIHTNKMQISLNNRGYSNDGSSESSTYCINVLYHMFVPNFLYMSYLNGVGITS